MKPLILLFSLCLIFSGCCKLCPKNNLSNAQLIKSYEVKTVKLISEAKKKSAEEKYLSALARELIYEGLELIERVEVKQPTCKKYFSYIKENIFQVQELTYRQAEKGWHDGDLLADAEPICAQAKELALQPATVQILIKKKNGKKIEEHLDSALDQLEELKNDLD